MMAARETARLLCVCDDHDDHDDRKRGGKL